MGVREQFRKISEGLSGPFRKSPSEAFRRIEAEGVLDFLRAEAVRLRQAGDLTATVIEHFGYRSQSTIIALHWGLRYGTHDWQSMGAGAETTPSMPVHIRYTRGDTWSYFPIEPWELKTSGGGSFPLSLLDSARMVNGHVYSDMFDMGTLQSIKTRGNNDLSIEELLLLNKLRHSEEVSLLDQLPLAIKLATLQADFRYGEGPNSQRGRLDARHHRILF